MHASAEQAVEALKKAGFRITVARRAIVDVVLASAAPVSAQGVSAALRKRGVSANVTTVYRELEFLRERGICMSVTLQDGVRRYESAALGHHHHLVCLECDAIQDVELPHDELHAAEKRIEKTHGFTVRQHALEFYGRCKNCP